MTGVQTCALPISEEMRKVIAEMPYAKWKKLGFSKGTLHPLKKKVEEGKSFRLSEEVRERLTNLDQVL